LKLESIYITGSLISMDHNPAEPHVLVFPFPAQSHVSTMLRFAELLCLANLKVTFLNSHYIHDRLLRCTDVEAHFANYPGLIRFKTIPDGLPEDHPRCGDHDRVREMFESTRAVTKPLFREMMVSGELSLGSSWSPVTCIVADGVISFAIDVAKISELWASLFVPLVLLASGFIFIFLDSLKQSSCPSKVCW
jgi:hypothetical protein